MGADLYIESVTDKARKMYEKKFQEACQVRDEYQKAHPDARCDMGFGDPKNVDPELQKLQDIVGDYYNKMSPEDGYFRDSYNTTSILWRLGISWWEDVSQLLNEGYMKVPKIIEFREMIDNAELNLPTFIELKEGNAKIDRENSLGEWHEYYRNKKTRFLAFLDHAIELNEPIYCSV